MSRPVPILEIGPFPPPYTGWSTRILFLKREIEKRGGTCRILNLGPNRRVPSRDYESVPGGLAYLLKVFWFALRGCRFHLHINGQSVKGLWLVLIAYAASVLSLHRPILTFHGGPEQTYFPKKNAPRLAFLFWLVFRFPRRVICNNENVRAVIADYGIDPAVIVAIPAFSRQYLEQDVAAPDAATEKFLANHRPVILSYLENREGYALESVFTALEAVATSFGRLGIVVVGAADASTTISDLASRHSLSQRLLHVGAVDHPEFLSLLRRATLYLRSARTEGTSSSIRESLYLGTPVVCNAAPDQPAGVQVYTWGNVASMVEVLTRTLANPAEARVAVDRNSIPDTLATEVRVLLDDGPTLTRTTDAIAIVGHVKQ